MQFGRFLVINCLTAVPRNALQLKPGGCRTSTTAAPRTGKNDTMGKIDGLFQILKEKGGSDLHLSPGNPPLIRRSGELEPVFVRPIGHEQNKAILYEIMTEAQRQEFEARQDLDFAYEVPSLESRFRANIFMGRNGISAVFPLIPAKILTVDQLGLPPAVLNFTRFKKGLVLAPDRPGAASRPPWRR